MLILFDHSTPAPLRYALKGHIAVEALERGWERFVNGDLLDAAESAGFELLLTADKNLRYQQNLTGRKIAIVVLGNAQWPVLRRHVEGVVAAVDAATLAAMPRWTSRSSNALSVSKRNEGEIASLTSSQTCYRLTASTVENLGIRYNNFAAESMTQPAGKYGELLSDLHRHLTLYGERHWTSILQQWIADLEQLERVGAPISGYATHLSRTKRSFGGMGSLNDVAITPQGGYSISNWKSRGVNTKLRKLTADLYSETLRLLRKLEPLT